jgi:hypothetical protein
MFEEPPAGAARPPAPAEPAEEAAYEFVPPTEAERPAEAAEVAVTPEALAGVSAQLLEVRQAIEDRMRQEVAQMAAQAAVTQSVESLQGVGNIQGVAIGLGDGTDVNSSADPGEPAVTVYVAEPSSADQVRAVLVDSMGIQAAATDAVPLTVVATGLIEAQPHRFRIRPAPGGVSVGHYRITAGTIGCLAVGLRPPRSSRLLVLSNNHVLANSNNALYGDCICQPGPYDGGRCPQDQIAIVERFVPINFAGGVNYVDCATGWAWPDRVRRELIYLRGGAPVYFRISSSPVAPALGMLVGKSGRTTQLTVGRITGIGATVRVNYGGGRVALFADQIAIVGTAGQFSAGGDSGSSIWTWNATRNPVALLFAGGGGVTFANRITRVLVALEIRLHT